ncbi:MAG: cytidylate kinase family protein [Oscillospiraceae bacterium]|nr:cytidylate kinase family protein [Oscillospiraceae bacterium]
MHISITGKPGSGKSTISNILKTDTGFQIFSTGALQREFALQHNLSTLEMNQLMTQDKNYDHLIDDTTTKISIEKKDVTIIFDSRMAWKFADNSFKVFVTIDPLVAATRVMTNPRGDEEVYDNLEDAKQKMIERSKVENSRFMDFYGVDTFDYSNYDLVVDSTYATANELASIIYIKYQEFIEAENKQHDILLSPKLLYPLAKVSDINIKTLLDYKEKRKHIDEPISIVALDGYHYIIDGHYRTLASIMNDEKLINVTLADLNINPLYNSTENLIKQIQAVGIAAVHDFEAIGEFQYKSYPVYYFGGFKY